MRRSSTWYAAAAGAFLVLGLTACSSGSTQPESSSSPPTSPPSASSTSPTSPGSVGPGESEAPSNAGAGLSPDCAAADVVVRTASELADALSAVTAGTTIRIEDGNYLGRFSASGTGTQEEPVTLCGGPGAVLTAGGPGSERTKGGSPYALHLEDASYWVVDGFTITDSQKGLVADRTTHSTFSNLTLSKIGDEAIHLRDFSTDNLVDSNTIESTGLRRAKFGEGVYVGTAESNWGDVTGGEPDASDRNVISGNTIGGTTAEAVDVKEGTTGGLVEGNTFDGAALSEKADSWVDIKGNDWQVVGNTGTNSPGDGFQTHDVVDGWGERNTFTRNTANVNGPGLGFAVDVELGNTVACDNVVARAEEGLASEACTA